MITGVNQAENAPAQKSVAGGASVRRDHDHPRHVQEDLTSGRRGHRQPGQPRDGDAGGAGHRQPGGGHPSPGPPVPEAKPPPDEPGLVMVRQLAGNDRSDEALGRLLDDLDGLNAPAHQAAVERRSAEPVAPFLTSKDIDGPFHRAASAYEWGRRTLNARDPIRPGTVYSERF